MALTASGAVWISMGITLFGQRKPSQCRLVSSAASQDVVEAIYPGLCSFGAIGWLAVSVGSLVVSQIDPAIDNPETLHGFSIAASCVGGIAWALQGGFSYKRYPGAHMGFASLAIFEGVIWMWLSTGLAFAMDLPSSIIAWRSICAAFGTIMCCGFGCSFSVGMEQWMSSQQTLPDKSDTEDTSDCANTKTDASAVDVDKSDSHVVLTLEDLATSNNVHPERTQDQGDEYCVTFQPSEADIVNISSSSGPDNILEINVDEAESRCLMIAGVHEYGGLICIALVLASYYTELESLKIVLQ